MDQPFNGNIDPVSRSKLEAEWNEMQQYAMLQREESQRTTREGLLKALQDRKQEIKEESKAATRALPLIERLSNLVAADVTNIDRNFQVRSLNRAMKDLMATSHREYTPTREHQEMIRDYDQANVLQHGESLHGATGELALSRAEWVEDQARKRLTSAGLAPAPERNAPTLEAQTEAQKLREEVYKRYVDNVVDGPLTSKENFQQAEAVFNATRQIDYTTAAYGTAKDIPALPEVSTEVSHSQQDLQAATRIDQRAEIIADLTPAERQAELQKVVVDSWVTADRSDLQMIQAEEVRESAEETVAANVETYAEYAEARQAQLQAEQGATAAPAPVAQTIEMPEFTHNGERATLDLSRFETVEARAQRETAEAAAAPAAPTPVAQSIEMPEFTHNGERATLDLSRFETVEARAQRETAEAAAEPAAPAPVAQSIEMPEFTHNGERATLDLNRFETVEARAQRADLDAPEATPMAAPAVAAPEVEPDPFGAALDAPEAAPVATPAAAAPEVEPDPFGAALDAPEAAPVATPAAAAPEVEPDPFGAALDAPEVTPVAAPAAAAPEVEPNPVGADLDAPEAAPEVQATPSAVSGLEGVELNAIEPVRVREAVNDARAPLDAANAPSMGREEIVLDAQTLNNLARMREADRQAAEEQLGHDRSQPRQRESQENQPQAREVERPARDNQVESDEIMTAPRETKKPILPPDVQRDYVSVGNKYYSQKSPEVVAFEDKGNKLETRSNNEEVAANLVKIAEARGWDEIKVTGTEKFRKEVWLEAAMRGMHVKGYTPSEADKASLAARSKGLGANSVENAQEFEAKAGKEKERAESFKKDSKETALKKHPELAGAYAAQAAAFKKLDADNLSPEAKQHVRHRIAENITNSIEKGNIPEVQKREEKTAQRGKNTEMEQSR